MAKNESITKFDAILIIIGIFDCRTSLTKVQLSACRNAANFLEFNGKDKKELEKLLGFRDEKGRIRKL